MLNHDMYRLRHFPRGGFADRWGALASHSIVNAATQRGWRPRDEWSWNRMMPSDRWGIRLIEGCWWVGISRDAHAKESARLVGGALVFEAELAGDWLGHWMIDPVP
jgi:hypothetical protein